MKTRFIGVVLYPLSPESFPRSLGYSTWYFTWSAIIHLEFPSFFVRHELFSLGQRHVSRVYSRVYCTSYRPGICYC